MRCIVVHSTGETADLGDGLALASVILTPSLDFDDCSISDFIGAAALWSLGGRYIIHGLHRVVSSLSQYITRS